MSLTYPRNLAPNGLVNDLRFVLITQDVAVTALQFKTMYTTPILIIPAPPSNRAILLAEITVFEVQYGTIPSAGGGDVILQYGNAPAAAGTLATGPITAATLNAITESTLLGMPNSAFFVPVPRSTSQGLGIYLTNATGVFTNTDSTFRMRVVYAIY